MRRLLDLIRRMRAGIRRSRLDDELRDEIDAHIALRREQLIAEGVSPDHADSVAVRGARASA